MTEQQQQQLTPIGTDELLAAIGELYLQVRVLRQVVARMQPPPPPQPPNGQVLDAIPEQ